MATVIEGQPVGERRFHERRRNWPSGTAGDTAVGAIRVSWGGVWSGVLMAVGLLMLLTALGVAVGITAVDPGQTDPSAFGTGAGIWGAVSLLLALFVGGLVATRGSAIVDRTTSLFEGALVWVVSLLIILYLAGSGLSTVAGGAFQIVGGATRTLGSAVSLGSTPDVDVSGTVDDIAARLRDPRTAQEVARATGLEVGEVTRVLQGTASEVAASRDDPVQAAQAARDGMRELANRAVAGGALERRAEAVQPRASAAAWWTFAALLLSLVAAVAGAAAGRRRDLSAAPPHATSA